MQITLPPVIQAIVEDELAKGRYESAEDVVFEAIRHLHDASVPYVADEFLVEARAQIERGETIPWTDDFLDRLSRLARENARHDDQEIPDEVKY